MDEFDLDTLLQQALDRLALLAEASEVLGSTLEAEEGLRRLCRVLVPQLADWCAVDLVDEDGGLRRAAVAHRHRAPAAPLEEGPLPPLPPEAEGPLARALHGAGPLLSGRPAEMAAPGGGRPTATRPLWTGELAGRVESAGVITAPLRARRRVLGALTVARIGPYPPLEEDLALVEDLAHRIALAVDNARLHAVVQRTAEEFQHALLPELPATDPLQLAARYRSARDETAEVGGDWYDAFHLPSGDLALIIGDVTGHDLQAAVEMSQLRNMLRGIACDRQEPPGIILHRLDVALHALSGTALGVTATCLYAIVHGPAAGPWELAHAGAGHLPPLLVSAVGDTRYLEGGQGLMLGVDPRSTRPSATTLLSTGSTMLLYTDGLVERRGESLDTSLTRLRQHAAALARRPLPELCDELITGMLPTYHRDDAALLALRLPPPP